MVTPQQWLRQQMVSKVLMDDVFLCSFLFFNLLFIHYTTQFFSVCWSVLHAVSQWQHKPQMKTKVKDCTRIPPYLCRNLYMLHSELCLLVGFPMWSWFEHCWCQPSVFQGSWHPVCLTGCCSTSLSILPQVSLMKWTHWSTFARVFFPFYVVSEGDT